MTWPTSNDCWKRCLELVVCLAPSVLTAQASHLTVNTPVEATVRVASTDRYALDLRAGDLVTAKIADKGTDELVLSVFNPSGTLERAFSTAFLDGEPARFRASRAGAWQLSVGTRAKGATSYTLTVLAISPPPTVSV